VYPPARFYPRAEAYICGESVIQGVGAVLRRAAAERYTSGNVSHHQTNSLCRLQAKVCQEETDPAGCG
jgi:hypothetical protein